MITLQTVYNQTIDGELNNELARKARVKGVSEEDTAIIEEANIMNLHKLAITHADTVIMGDEKIELELESFIQQSGKKTLSFQSEEKYIAAYNELYDDILDEEAVLS